MIHWYLKSLYILTLVCRSQWDTFTFQLRCVEINGTHLHSIFAMSKTMRQLITFQLRCVEVNDTYLHFNFILTSSYPRIWHMREFGKLLLYYVYVFYQLFNFGYDAIWLIVNRDLLYFIDDTKELEVRVMVFNATFNNISAISWRSVLLVEETRIPGENHRPATSHWQSLSHNVVSSTPRH